MLASVADRILHLHGWVALAMVFALPALESSAFIGFVFPGEIAVLLGGVLASQHHLSLPAVLAAAAAGAVIGDSVGYEIGKRWGKRLLHGTVGRVVRHEHLDRAERYLRERGSAAVFFGRFTAALRVLIPGLAGMARLPYRRFLAYNAAGGILWASGFVLAGYLAGGSWRHVEHLAGQASLVLLLLAAVVAAVVAVARWAVHHPERTTAAVERGLDRPAVARLRRRFDRELSFLARRFDPGAVRGLSLTLGLALLALAGWAFGALTEDVIAGNEAARFDRPVLTWFADHREPWLTHTFTAVTSLGSSALVVPLVIVVGVTLWARRRERRPFVFLAAAYSGAEVLLRTVKHLTARPRPPLGLAVAHYAGSSFPSGHATLAITVWGGVALAVADSSWTRAHRIALRAAATAVALIVGVTRLYLGAHWLTDVLAGWALGAAWLAAAFLAFRPGRPTRHP